MTAPWQCLFLCGKPGVSGQTQSLLISQLKRLHFHPMPSKSHQQKALTHSRSGHSLRDRNKSKVSCLEQMVTAVSDLGDQSLQAVRWQICTLMFCYHLCGQWHSRIHCSVTHRHKLSCIGCLKKAKWRVYKFIYFKSGKALSNLIQISCSFLMFKLSWIKENQNTWCLFCYKIVSELSHYILKTLKWGETEVDTYSSIGKRALDCFVGQLQEMLYHKTRGPNVLMD